MSSPSEVFECHWQASRLLLVGYCALLVLALGSLLVVQLPWWLRLPLALACIIHAIWLLPRKILLSHPQAITGLRRDARAWQLFSRADGWQAVQLRRDSIALPQLVVLRFRLKGQRFSRSVCIATDALPREAYRRLRVRLKFSRRRWAAIE